MSEKYRQDGEYSILWVNKFNLHWSYLNLTLFVTIKKDKRQICLYSKKSNSVV